MTPENAFEQFKPVMAKLHSEGFLSGDFSWWSSRWYEWLNYKGNDSKAEWQRKADLNKLFPQVWDLFEPEFTQRKLMTNSLLDSAIKYVTDWDFAVFPLHSMISSGICTCASVSCTSPGKHPMPYDGFKSATKDIQNIELWWTNWQFANIGIATGKVSNIVVLDVDPKNGGDVSLKNLCDEIGEFSTYTVKTGGDGLHFYFRYPTDCEIKNSAGATNNLGAGLDIRGEGGYVVAPPSNHLSGKNYEIVYDGIIAELPDKLKEKLLQPKQVQQPAASGIRATQSTAPYITPPTVLQGSRNLELTKLAGSLRRSGLSELALTSALQIENQRLCVPPLDDSEVRRIAHSVSRYAPDEVLQAVADDPNLQNVNNVNQVQKITTTACYKIGDFRRMQFPPRDVIGFHIAKKEWAILAAIKNVGKSTFLRNVAMCMAAGKPFAPFVESTIPRKVLYLDFETTNEMLCPDVNLMMEQGKFDSVETDLIDENLYVIPKGLIDGELFTMQKSLVFLENLCKDEKIEFVIVDNLSAGFQVLDESSSGVMNQKVVQPVLKFIQSADVGLMMCHHSGKSNSNDSYAGRGSSVLEDLASVGFKMDGDTHNGGAVTISNVKRKDGQGYSLVFKLNTASRWFESTTIAPKQKQKPLDVQIQEFVQSFDFPNMVSTKEINEKFDFISRMQINRILTMLKSSDYISSPKKGVWCAYVKP